MNVRVIPHHSPWIESVMSEVVHHRARVVFVSSHNEAVLLRRQKQTWSGRVWVLGHLEPGEVMAEVGRGRLPDDLFSAPSFSDTYYFLLEKVDRFYRESYRCFLPIQEARTIVQTFMTLFLHQQSASFFEHLDLGYGKKHKAYQEVFVFLHKCLRGTEMDLVQNQKVLHDSLLASDLVHCPVIIAVSQPLNDSVYGFVDACQELFQGCRILLYGEEPQSLCVHDAHFFIKRILGRRSGCQDSPSQYTNVCDGYACERYSDEVDCVVGLAKDCARKGTVIITSRQLVFLRSIMYRMRAEGLAYWNGLGDFFWDLPDGRWVLRCADFLCHEVTAISLHAVFAELVSEKVLHLFDKGFLRQEVFSRKGCERFFLKNDPEVVETLKFVFESWRNFQAAKDGRTKVGILNALVRKRAFCFQEADAIWGEFCASRYLGFLSVSQGFTAVLKSMIMRSVVHKRVAEHVLFVHPNDARILGADTVICAGFYDVAQNHIVDEAGVPQEALGLRSHFTRSTEILDFLGCLSQKKVICTWHKTGQGGQVRSVSHLWFYAQKRVSCQEHAYTVAPKVYVPYCPQPYSICAASGCLPETLSATQIARLFHNPYDFYMRFVLGLEVLKPLGDDTTSRQEGIFVHAVMAVGYPNLRACMRGARALYSQFFAEKHGARLERLLRVICDLYTVVSSSGHVFAEHSGSMELDMLPKRTVVMRADRMDVWDDVVRIGDFKTGSKDALKALFSEIPVGWQLAVEGLIAHYGTVDGLSQVAECSLCVWHSQGRGAQTFSMAFDAQKAEEIKNVLVHRLQEYCGQGVVTFALPEGVKSFYTYTP